MPMPIHRHILPGALVLALLVACSPAAPPAATPPTPAPDTNVHTATPAVAATVAPAGGPYQPILAEYCEQFRNASATLLGVEVSATTGPFNDLVTGEGGQGCVIEARGTGAIFTSPTDVMALLRPAFIGWEEDLQYLADGPTGTATAFRRDAGLALVTVMWMPAPEANCAPDEPIMECELTPEQRLYTIQIQVAQK